MVDTTGLITLERASEIIGVNVDSLHGEKKTKYTPFKKSVSGSREVMFDIKGYLKQESLQEELVEKTKLFVEYLYHIEGLSYTRQAILGKVRSQPLSASDFGYGFGYKFLKNISDALPFHLIRFDKYYGWETAPIRRQPISWKKEVIKS